MQDNETWRNFDMIESKIETWMWSRKRFDIITISDIMISRILATQEQWTSEARSGKCVTPSRNLTIDVTGRTGSRLRFTLSFPSAITDDYRPTVFAISCVKTRWTWSPRRLALSSVHSCEQRHWSRCNRDELDKKPTITWNVTNVTAIRTRCKLKYDGKGLRSDRIRRVLTLIWVYKIVINQMPLARVST
jgi:hypothetical protein